MGTSAVNEKMEKYIKECNSGNEKFKCKMTWHTLRSISCKLYCTYEVEQKIKRRKIQLYTQTWKTPLDIAIERKKVVYNIPYRRALGLADAFRPSARASKGILHTRKKATNNVTAFQFGNGSK